MPYLTPFSTPTIDAVCRSFSIPEDYLPIVIGALLELTFLWNWEAIAGESVDTPEEAVEKMAEMLEGMGECKMAAIGSIIPYISEDPPDGTLPCDGSVYFAINYLELYQVLSPIFQMPPFQFYLPDLRGRALIGAGAGPGLTARQMGHDGGEETAELEVASMPAHGHGVAVNALNAVGNAGSPGGNVWARSSGHNIYTTAEPDVVMGADAVEIGNTGGGGEHENMQPFGVVGYAVVYE